MEKKEAKKRKKMKKTEKNEKYINNFATSDCACAPPSASELNRKLKSRRFNPRLYETL